MKTPYDRLAKIHTNCSGHMTKMAAMSIFEKKQPFTNLLQNQKADNLWAWYVAFGMCPYQDCINDDPRLTLIYFTARSNLILNVFIWKES